MKLATRAVPDDREDPPPTSTLSFSFVIDASGRGSRPIAGPQQVDEAARAAHA